MIALVIVAAKFSSMVTLWLVMSILTYCSILYVCATHTDFIIIHTYLMHILN